MLKSYLILTFESGNATRRLAALGLLLSLCAVGMGLQTDDHVLRYQATHTDNPLLTFSQRLPPLEELQERGFTWWRTAGKKQRFLRPLASLSHSIDFYFFADAVWWARVQNGLLYALLIAAVCWCFRLLGLPPLAVGLGGLFYTLNAGNALSVGWISGRNTLLYTLFSVLTLALHHRARTESSPWPRLLAPLCLMLGLAGGEGAVAAVGYLIAHAVFLDSGKPRSRVLAMLPYLVIVVAWRIYYVSAGYGVSGAGWYLDVEAYPGRFVLASLEALPVYLATLLTLPLANLSIFGAGPKYGLIGASIATLLLLWPVFRPLLREHATLRFALLGAALSVVPLGATQIQDRLTTLAAVGTSALLGMLVAHHWTQAGLPGARTSRVLFRMHTYVSLVIFVLFLFANTPMNSRAEAIVDRVSRDDSTRSVLLNAPNWVVLIYPAFIADAQQRPLGAAFYTLYVGASAINIRRVGERSLEVSPDGGFVPAVLGATGRLDPPFKAGQVRTFRHMRALVLSVDDRGAPQSVRFEFDVPLGDPTLRLLVWKGDRPVEWNPPAVGESVRLESSRTL